MNFKIALISAACVLVAFGPLQAADAPATQPAATATTQPAAPATQPAPTVLATVGKAKIMSSRVDHRLEGLPPNIPADKLGELRERVLGELIIGKLIHSYLDAKKIPLDPNEYAAMNDKLTALAAQQGTSVKALMAGADLTEQELRDQIRLKTLGEQTTADAKADAFIKANPSCFNGTKVQASHILILCPQTASTEKQKAAITKLEKIAADIKAGKITFEAAAKANSDCPSKEKGGDLGEFGFQDMVLPFGMKAFGMKVGDVSGIVRTKYGFHIIKLTKRTEGTGKPADQAQAIAKQCLFSNVLNDILDQALTTCPIVVANAK